MSRSTSSKGTKISQRAVVIGDKTFVVRKLSNPSIGTIYRVIPTQLTAEDIFEPKTQYYKENQEPSTAYAAQGDNYSFGSDRKVKFEPTGNRHRAIDDATILKAAEEAFGETDEGWEALYEDDGVNGVVFKKKHQVGGESEPSEEIGDIIPMRRKKEGQPPQPGIGAAA